MDHTPPYVKMHTVGNVIIVFLQYYNWQTSDIQRICDPVYGIGADQVMEYDKGFVRIWNKDGSRARACGNGTRCLAAWLNKSAIMTGKIDLMTDSGLVSVWPCAQSSLQERWCVLQGHAVLGAEDELSLGLSGLNIRDINPSSANSMDITATSVDKKNRRAFLLCHQSTHNKKSTLTPVLVWPKAPKDSTLYGITGMPVHMGNPHLIVLGSPKISVQDGLAATRHPAFPDGVNVSFIHWQDNRWNQEVSIHTWERGAGATLGCGSGACASAAYLFSLDQHHPVVCALRQRGALKKDELFIHMPGGSIHVTNTPHGLVHCAHVHYISQGVLMTA